MFILNTISFTISITETLFHIWLLLLLLLLLLCRYCPDCKTNAGEVIQAGEKMRLTKKKANMQSKKGTCQRDWGKVG